MIQFSPLHHQGTAQIKPVGGRTLILKHSAAASTKSGLIHIPEQFQGRRQEDWRAEVVANAEHGGWRTGALQEWAVKQWAHLLDLNPGDIPKKLRRNKSIWKVLPYFVEKPELPVGSRIICCHLSGQPVIARNGQQYFLTDGEHVYKAVINN